MYRQRGVSLSGLLIVCVILGLVAVGGMKVGPSVAEYYTILKHIKTITSSGEIGAGATVADVRKAFQRRAQIDNVTAITADDLEVSKDGGELVISFSYPKKIPLFGPVSLYIDFEGSSSGKSN